MLPALVLSIAIRAEFWRPLDKQGKAEWIIISVCCPPQNEHIDIKKVASSHVEVTGSFKDVENAKNSSSFLLLLIRLRLRLRHTFFVQAVSPKLLLIRMDVNA